MDTLHISLFGRFSIARSRQVLTGCDGGKVQELLSYLLLHRRRLHSRDALATLLWGDQCTTVRAKSYLRKTLWQIQSAFGEAHGDAALLLVEPEWVGLNEAAPVELDVAVFEAAYDAVRGRGQPLDPAQALAVEAAVGLYRGDLLEGCYQEWCLVERERLKHIYLVLLDRLTDYCEARGLYEAGLGYGSRILHVDAAREHTHRRLMSLRYLAGDRTGALRQYEACAAVLREELNVQPSKQTTLLCDLIREDRLDRVLALTSPPPVDPKNGGAPLAERLDRIKMLEETMMGIQAQILHEIEAVRLVLARREP